MNCPKDKLCADRKTGCYEGRDSRLNCFVELGQGPQAATEADVCLNNLLSAIADELHRRFAAVRRKHDNGGWPQKFLYAQEGVGLLSAIKIVEKHKKPTGI